MPLLADVNVLDLEFAPEDHDLVQDLGENQTVDDMPCNFDRFRITVRLGILGRLGHGEFLFVLTTKYTKHTKKDQK